MSTRVDEATFVQLLKRHFCRVIGLEWTRLESNTVNGIPDILLGYKGHAFFVEAKYIPEEDLPKRSTTLVKVGLRPEQRLWLEAHAKIGLKVFVFARIGDNYYIFHEKFGELYEGMLLSDMDPYLWFEGRNNFKADEFLDDALDM